MDPAHNPYDTPRVAAGYAFARPAVHPQILRHVREYLHLTGRVERALDIGCGAGRSTAALDGLADTIVGIEPAAAMLAHRRDVAPRAHFVIGQAERLPFGNGAFDLMTAAGAINYADLNLAIPEAARVLASRGTLVVYDFSAGRRLGDGSELDEWYEEFDRRYPDAPGYAIDVTSLPWERADLVLAGYEAFEVPIAMTLESYLRYAMSETRVELALSGGATDTDVRDWCRQTLQNVFAEGPRAVIFDAYAAYVTHRVPTGRSRASASHPDQDQDAGDQR